MITFHIETILKQYNNQYNHIHFRLILRKHKTMRKIIVENFFMLFPSISYVLKTKHNLKECNEPPSKKFSGWCSCLWGWNTTQKRQFWLWPECPVDRFNLCSATDLYICFSIFSFCMSIFSWKCKPHCLIKNNMK